MILRLSGTECHFEDTVYPKLLYTLKTACSNVLAKLAQPQAIAPTSAMVNLEQAVFVVSGMSHLHGEA